MTTVNPWETPIWDSGPRLGLRMDGDWAGFEALVHSFPKGHQPTGGFGHCSTCAPEMSAGHICVRINDHPCHFGSTICLHSTQTSVHLPQGHQEPAQPVPMRDLFISWRALSKLNSLVTCSCKSQPGPKKWKMRSALSPET